MLVVFRTSYRSRAWCARFAAGEVVDVTNLDLLDELRSAGVVDPVEAERAIAPPPTPTEVETTDDDPVPSDLSV